MLTRVILVFNATLDYDWSLLTTSSPSFFLKDSKVCRLFSRGVIFTRARVSLALLSLRKNGAYS